MIRPMTVSDVSEIVAIYAHYVNNTVVTFDTEVPSETEMCQRLCPIMEHYPAWVYVEDGKIAGYCYAHEWKTKKPIAPPLRQPSTSIRTIPAKDTDVY